MTIYILCRYYKSLLRKVIKFYVTYLPKMNHNQTHSIISSMNPTPTRKIKFSRDPFNSSRELHAPQLRRSYLVPETQDNV
jgi:hypothetical protein